MNSPKINKLVLCFFCVAVALFASGCAEIGELRKPLASPYYGKIVFPPRGEFRWANGELPKTFDPAAAQSPSEMQAVRATFDGLTDWDQQTLEAVPALAVRWETSEDFRNWTFYLRPEAVWSNGNRITAQDFVRSWRRLRELKNSPHRQLLFNIIGAKQSLQSDADQSIDYSNQIGAGNRRVENQNLKSETQQPGRREKFQNPEPAIQNETWFGAEAVDNLTLRVYLVLPDKDFPKLVAHSALRPVWSEDEFENPKTAAKSVTSGAFRFGSYDQGGVLLERSKTYWNNNAAKIERVRLISAKNAETALSAYQAGEVDAVTNAHLEPLTFKLLASYPDFKREVFNAVTFYEFNRAHSPFDDRRVREALASALDRERLTNDELEGAAFPAYKFLPNSTAATVFNFDLRRAQNLLIDAGFPNGKNFPKIKLLVNRNDSALRLAKAIAAQWQKNLHVETEITASSLEELDHSMATNDFDLVRRVLVLPTSDETINVQAMFGANDEEDQSLIVNQIVMPSAKIKPIIDESQAFDEIPAIPLYFPSSYALVKPFVKNFEMNLLDAPSLKDVEIDASWQLPQN